MRLGRMAQKNDPKPHSLEPWRSLVVRMVTLKAYKHTRTVLD